MKKHKRFLLAAALALVGVAAVAGAQQQPFKPYDIGLSVGIVAPGSIWVSMVGDNVISAVSPMIKLSADAYLIPKLAMGVYGQVVFATLDHLETDSQQLPDRYRTAAVYEFGGAIRPCFRAGDKVVIKPGLEFGYRMMTSDLEVYYYGGDVVKFGTANALGLNGNVEVKLLSATAASPFMTAGVLSQPVGGNKDTEVTFAPIFYFCGGVSF